IDPTNTANVTTAPATKRQNLTPATQENSRQTSPSIYLQLGAFNTLQNANRLKTKLSHQLALQSNIKQLEKTASTLYLVRIGPYHTIAQAELDRLKLQRLGIHHSHFVSQ
ncbi:MAG: SPOR domain-containing protein, partial [Cycloclasticus sp.]